MRLSASRIEQVNNAAGHSRKGSSPSRTHAYVHADSPRTQSNLPSAPVANRWPPWSDLDLAGTRGLRRVLASTCISAIKQGGSLGLVDQTDGSAPLRLASQLRLINKLEELAGCCFNSGAGKYRLHVPLSRSASSRGAGGEVPGAGPIVRRRELGVFLRALRTEKGWTVDEVAGQLLCSAAKISRIETGRRGASARDIRDLCDLYEIRDQAERHRLSILAQEGRQQTWWQARGLPSSTYYGLEADATHIRDCGFVVIPGLLQTADYARAVIRAVTLNLPPEEVEVRVQQRMARHRVLDSASSPQFHAVLDEAVLHRVVGSRSIMRIQLEHLLEMSRRPNVTVQVLPSEAGAVSAGPNKFIILDFKAPSIPSVVFIENLTGDLYLDRAEDVERYDIAFSDLVKISATPQNTRDMVATKAQSYQSP